MTAIVFPHVCCNGGIITDLSGYGCIPGNLGLPEKYLSLSGGTITANGKALEIKTTTPKSPAYVQLTDSA
ncbi:hypothetical protein, partial [Morganella morganii]|uniref:hypothetical protein n=1 Tax=Morganella morganii TaxID=582 RepID=UPI003EC10C61